MRLTTLHPRPPYNLGLMLDILSRYAHPTLDFAYDGAYWRALDTDEGMALLRATARGGPQSPALEVDLIASTGQVDSRLALARLQHVLYVESDHEPFYAYARSDPALWRVVEPLVGLPELRAACAFEALAQAIIEQQIAWTAAQRAQRWLVEWAGKRIHHEGRDYFAFPTAAQIASATVDELKPLKITFKRIALLIDLARQVAEGQLDLERLHDLGAKAVYDALLAIKGVGHWTAVVTLERAFGHHLEVAHNDVALQAAINFYFHGGEGRIPAHLAAATLNRYGQYAGVAAHYTLSRWVLDRYPPQQ